MLIIIIDIETQLTCSPFAQQFTAWKRPNFLVWVLISLFLQCIDLNRLHSKSEEKDLLSVCPKIIFGASHLFHFKS